MSDYKDEILIHLGENRGQYFDSVVPPIIQSANFRFRSIEQFREKIMGEIDHHVYSRGNNPTVEILRKKMAALENADDALITSSGAAAISCAVMANVKSGDHIICVQKPYSWTYKLLHELLHGFAVETTFVDGTDTRNINDAIKQNTRLLFLESPNSLTFELQDLKACSKIARDNNLITIIDNSYCSPIFQKPLDFGIDIVVHSGTKYINGHSDVVMGVICGKKDMIDKIFRSPYMTLGVNISPHDAWLVLRGLRTLPLRIAQSNNTASRIVNFLANHPKVNKVIYPHHPDFPQFALAKSQMKGCGGLFTLDLKAKTKSQVAAFVNSLECFLMAVSWGGYESLMIPSLVFHDMPGREDSPIPWTYIRFYIGLESYEFLKKDFQQAFDKM